MKPLLNEIRHNPLLWLLAFVPIVLAAAKLKPEAPTLLFPFTGRHTRRGALQLAITFVDGEPCQRKKAGLV